MPSPTDILLINPWIYDFTAYDVWLRPLGLLYVASFLKKHRQFRLNYIDCLDRRHPGLPKILPTKPDGRGPYLKEEVPKPDILADIPRKYSRYGIPVSAFLEELECVPLPRLVLITCTMTYWYPGVQLVVELVRKKFGSVPVILGGIYATLLPDHAKRATGVDFICAGPGEKNLPPILQKTLDNYRLPQNLDQAAGVPAEPEYGLLRDRENLPIITSRGCPYSCSFCATGMLNPKFEQDLPTSAVERIEGLHKKFGTKNVAFYDDALLINKKDHILPILRGIIEKKLQVAFHTPNGLHVKEIDSELAVLFKQSNFSTLFLSQESFDENVLRDSCPKVEKDDLEKALTHLENAGYHRKNINVYLIVGLPDQGISSIKEAIVQVKKLGAHPRLAFFSPVVGTSDWHKAVGLGYMQKDADPLLHNKMTFPYLWGRLTPEDFISIRELLSSD